MLTRVLVTGASGLLGSNVTAELLATGAEVLALARGRERAARFLPAHTAEIAAMTGAREPREAPAALAMAGSSVIELTARLQRRERAATRALLEGDRLHLTSRRAEHQLGVTFRPLAQIVADEAGWYRHHGLLPSCLRGPTASAAS